MQKYTTFYCDSTNMIREVFNEVKYCLSIATYETHKNTTVNIKIICKQKTNCLKSLWNMNIKRLFQNT